MAACSEHHETLLLDVHGELSPEQRIAWEQHLAGCEGCRSEQERLRALLRNAHDALCVPGLTSQEEQVISDRVQRALRTHTPATRSNRAGWLLAPACAACMVLVVAGWFGLQNTGPDPAAINAGRVPEETAGNNELLENMELLQEMESLERLVNLLDKQYQETSLLERGDNADRVRAHV